MNLKLVLYIVKKYGSFALFTLLFVIIFICCSNPQYYQADNKIQIYTVLDSIKNEELTDLIVNSNHIGNSIKEYYKDTEIIEKSIPQQKKNYIDIYTTNFPVLALERKWEEIEDKSENTISYLKWDFPSPTDTTMYFLYSSDYDCSLWVNKSSILSESGKKSSLYYKKSKQIYLKKGNNSFIVELVKNKKCETNCFSFSLLSADEAVNEFVHTLNNNYLSRLILNNEDSLFVNTSVIKDIVPAYKYSILNKGDTIFSATTLNFHENISSNVQLNECSSYSCVLSFDTHSVRQPFIVGNPDTIYKRLLADRALANDTLLYPYFYRLNKLIEIKKRDYWWQHKVALMFEKINDASYRNSGVSLFSFNSKIDGTKQNYIAITPEKIDRKKKYPLIIIFRPAYKYKTHLLTSMFLHKVWSLNYVVSLCNLNQYVVLISSNRSYLYEDLSPIGEADVVESLDDVKSRYNIDNDRVFLFGSCLGARKALRFAENQNSNYTGIALYNPAFSIDQQFNFERTKHLPIYLRHDIYDEHTPIWGSERFVKKAKKKDADVRVVFDNYFRHSYFNFFIDQDVFSFFSGLESTGPSIKKPPANVPITIKNFFANRFCIVYGTKESTSSLKNIADTLVKQWEDYFYEPCRLYADTNNVLKQDTISNFLLIGNQENNSITDSLLAQEDLVWISKEIKQKTDQKKNDDSTYEFLFEHKNRLFIIIGTTDNSKLKYDFRYYPWFNANYKTKISSYLYE